MAPSNSSLGDRVRLCRTITKKKEKKVKFAFKLKFKKKKEDPGIRLTFQLYL